MERLMSDGYPFIFQMIDKSESDEYLIQTLQYRFKSDKSHHAYIVRVECYKKHAYCVKFFDKANINSKNKFRFVNTIFFIRATTSAERYCNEEQYYGGLPRPS